MLCLSQVHPTLSIAKAGGSRSGRETFKFPSLETLKRGRGLMCRFEQCEPLKASDETAWVENPARVELVLNLAHEV
jgi:hypothetical protein